MGCLESESKCHGLDFGFRETDYHKKKPLVFSDLEVPYISPAWFQALPDQKAFLLETYDDPNAEERSWLCGRTVGIYRSQNMNTWFYLICFYFAII